MNVDHDLLVASIQRPSSSGPKRRTGKRRLLHTRQAPRSRPRLEALEDRAVPTAGFLDPTFGAGGAVLTNFPGTEQDNGKALAVQPDGKFVVVVESYITGQPEPVNRLVRHNT